MKIWCHNIFLHSNFINPFKCQCSACQTYPTSLAAVVAPYTTDIIKSGLRVFTKREAW